MIGISIVSSIVTFALSVYLARVLGTDGFQEYIVAVAALSLLGTLSEFGTGKYALKILPQYAASKKWSLAAGYWRFSFALVLGVSLLITLVVILSEFGHDKDFGDYLLGVAILFLPSTALVAVVAEFLMANRAAISGTIITRLVCPLATFGLIGLVFVVNGSVSSTDAIICFGSAGVIGLLIACLLFYRTSPGESLTAKSERQTRKWLRNCVWFSTLAFLMAWVFDISVIVLEIAQVAELEIARYGAAAKTGCFILLVAKSTNKFYNPELAMIMSTGDWQRALKLRSSRLLLIGSSSVVYLLVMIFFGKRILLWFGPEYLDAHLALCFVSFGACVATTFSMASEYLKFSEKLKTVMFTTCVCGILLVVLTWILGTRYGATGAGLAFGIVITLMTLFYLHLTNQMLRENLTRSQKLATNDQAME